MLLIHALETANAREKEKLNQLLKGNSENKVQEVTSVFMDCKVNLWANELKEKYITEAFMHLEDIAVLSKRKEPLKQLPFYLTQRES